MSEQPTPAAQPGTVTFYWIATIEREDGTKLHCHATAEVVPGPNARGNAVRDILGFLAQRHGEFLLLFVSLEPNEISAPAVTQ
ncbi:hypothetical protein [Streptomyces caniscabiei]|uniref:hypothetical protein n=1 Tax=Streptomyces caniscabiei TaxID=2746961 RepID=UPI00187313A7|nr:hypothetical protein [Streptomyces caniscabiei]MBE4735728.1 hypothetical protein [Streptomyces caniscabiei]MBE4758341.1 hypothetical protein [Streptomyces caniscabiei]